MPTNCVFKFDRARPIYYSGEQTCGIITLTTTKVMRLEAIIINCKGLGQVNWFDDERTKQIEYNDSNKDGNQIQYHGYESYTNENSTLYERLQLHPGQHEYKFSFKLPEQCPATLAQKYGEIFYSVNLMLKRRSKFDKIYEQRFLVKNRLDLNKEKEKYLMQNIIQQTDSGIHFTIDRTGFVPGQLIKFYLKVPRCEEARDNMQKFRVRLCQKYIFKCQHPEMCSKEIVCTSAIEKGNIPADTIHHPFTYEAGLRIPLLTPMTSSNPAAIISVSYFLEAVILSKQKFVHAKFTIPITIGTKALKDIVSSDSTFELEDYCYDNFRAIQFKGSYEEVLLQSANKSVSTSYVDLNTAQSLIDFERSPFLTKKLRRFTKSNIIKLPMSLHTCPIVSYALNRK